MEERYFEPPSHDIFVEIKENSIKIWKENYSNEFGYVSDKIKIINDLHNFRDNAMYIVGMFDFKNRMLLLQKLSPLAKDFVMEKIEMGREGLKDLINNIDDDIDLEPSNN